MSKYLAVIIPGNSSLALELFELPKLKSVWQAKAEQLNQKNSFIVERGIKKNQLNFQQGLTYSAAFKQLVKLIPKEIYGQITTIGHQVMALGPEPAMISVVNKDLLKKLRQWSFLAPSYNETSQIILPASFNAFPKAKQWAVADSAFLNSLPLKAKTYALPAKITNRFNLKKIGYQGLVHQFLLKATANKLKTSESKVNIITIQLGNISSVCLIQNGRAVDVSFGLSLSSGLSGARQLGDADPYLMIYLLEQGYTTKELKALLFQESGWLGVCGLVDFRDILQAAGFVVNNYKTKIKYSPAQKSGARLALEIFIYQLQKTIGSFSAVAGSLQAIVWGGTIGCQSEVVRKLVWGGLHLAQKPKNFVVAVDEAALITQLLLANTKTI
ncbi:MAG: hypothetical protein NTV81_01430 [Candidatus Komeilibacteria bacterium]|nr:hypothetical protein [Candidatus Komeilibacteria bacterium]